MCSKTCPKVITMLLAVQVMSLFSYNPLLEDAVFLSSKKREDARKRAKLLIFLQRSRTHALHSIFHFFLNSCELSSTFLLPCHVQLCMVHLIMHYYKIWSFSHVSPWDWPPDAHIGAYSDPGLDFDAMERRSSWKMFVRLTFARSCVGNWARSCWARWSDRIELECVRFHCICLTESRKDTSSL